MLIGPRVTVRDRTKFAREAVQDGETMKLIAEAASQQVKMVYNRSVGWVHFFGGLFFEGGGGIRMKKQGSTLRVSVTQKELEGRMNNISCGQAGLQRSDRVPFRGGVMG